MHRTKALLLGAALAIAACSKHARDAGDDCAAAFQHARSIALAALPADMSPAMSQGMHAAIDSEARDGAAHCRADHWSAATLSCMQRATTSDELTQCFASLTPAQRDALDKAKPRPAGGSGAAPGSDLPDRH